MNKVLFAVLDENIGHQLTHELALKILGAASMPDPLVESEAVARIQPEEHEGCVLRSRYMAQLPTSFPSFLAVKRM